MQYRHNQLTITIVCAWPRVMHILAELKSGKYLCMQCVYRWLHSLCTLCECNRSRGIGSVDNGTTNASLAMVNNQVMWTIIVYKHKGQGDSPITFPRDRNLTRPVI